LAFEQKDLKGFILTRQWLESSSGLELIYWLWTESGPSRLRLKDQEAVMFIDSSSKEHAYKLLRSISGWRLKETALKAFNHNAVSAMYFRSQRLLYRVKEKLSSEGISCYESDIKPPDRYLMERFIQGGVSIRADQIQRSGFLDLQNGQLAPAQSRPAFRAVSIDIETDFDATELYSIAIYSNDVRSVHMIGEAPAAATAKPDYLLLYPNQKSLIEGFLAEIEAIDPDIIMGWNVVNFDLSALQRFTDQQGLTLSLGRNAEKVSWRVAVNNPERAYALVPGRIVLDGIELMRSATYQFENFSLEHVAQKLLGRGKLVEDVDARGAEITTLFNTQKHALAAYNIEDCKLVWDIFDKEKLIDFAIERSLLTGLELDRYGGSVAAFDFLYLPRLHRKGYVSPALEQVQASNISPGGYVMNSQPGIHTNVIVLDFKSLYPSIIRTFHVDPLALVTGLEARDPIIGFDGGKFSREQAILPDMITTLWAARDNAKQGGNSALSQAIKIIMNSFYGVLGTSGCRFLDSRLVSSITKRGHEIIIQSKKFIESKGYNVIYGDTDSVFIQLGDIESAEVPAVGANLAAEMNRWWQQKIQKDHRIVSHLEIEFETHFEKFLMPTIRGSKLGSKKRYAGLTSSGELVFKGLETVRSDWSPLAREFQQELYRRVFFGLPYVEYVKDTVSSLIAGGLDEKLVLRKRLRRKLMDYIKNVPPHVQAARKAEQMREARGLSSLYASGGWIDYIMTVSGPEPKQYQRSLVDYDFYIEKQMAPIADAILVFESSSMELILNRQFGLFSE
jgi:DNA polymerase-2